MIGLLQNKQLAEEHFNIVKGPIQKRIKGLVKENILKSGKNYKLNPKILSLITPYLNDVHLKELITCPPEVLNQKVEDLNLNRQSYLNKKSLIYKLLERVFVDHGYEKFDKLQFINKIGVHTCPYCNRNYIYSLDKNGKIKPEIDHFYPKGIYPLLGACYYNLIPSCQTCNGFGGKYESDTFKTKITNPYLIKETDFKFKFTPISIAIMNPLSGKSSVKVEFENSLSGHFDVFKLDKLYTKHSDHVLELIVKSKLKYSSKYREYLRSYKGLKFSEIELNRLILGNYSREKELHKRPLSKLYSDAGKWLGLITDLSS